VFPRLRTTLETRVAIVGGGLTGCACAYAFAAKGIPVVVLEAQRIGSGATGGAPGVLRDDFDVPFAPAAAEHGLRAARTLWEGARRAARDFASVLRRTAIPCQLSAADFLSVTMSGSDAARRMRREYEARRAAGLEGTWATPAKVAREMAVASGGAIRMHGSVLDPYRACTGLASLALRRGAAVFEHTAVRRVRASAGHVEIVTTTGHVRAEAVLVAGAASIPDFRQLQRHLHSRHGYAVVTEPLPAAVRRSTGPGAAVLRDDADPPHLVRRLKEDRVLVAGADQAAIPERAKKGVLVQRTGQLMYELSLMYPAISGLRPEWSWSYAYQDTADGLPFIGTHRNFPRHLFALGTGRHGAAISWLAATLLLRQFVGEPMKGDPLFGFARTLR
jgi:glycine/D-amino acid oxidase-like deaminating enzyme